MQLGFKSADGSFQSYADEPMQTVLENGWLIASRDEEELVVYYTKPLQQKETTTEFVDAVKLDNSLGNSYTNQALNLQFEVNAVQSDLGADAIAAEWGVFPNIGADQNITSISETK